MLIGLLAVEGL
jgi:predicted ferric reductase